MLIHGHMSHAMMQTKIIPLVKNKCGKLSDKNNYRPVAIANSLSKVFELFVRCEIVRVSCAPCTINLVSSLVTLWGCVYMHYMNSLTTIKTNALTNVYMTFFYANKAFDRINHRLLFDKLLKRQMTYYIVRILLYWYP